MGCYNLLITLVLLTVFAQSFGQVEVCSTNLTGAFGDIVVEEKESCVLESVTADNITIKADGKLEVKGISEITGINAGDGAMITLKNRTTVCTVTATNSASINITAEKTSFVKLLVLSEAGNTLVQGPFGSIESDRSGVLNVFSSSVNDSIRVLRGGGAVNICGSIVMSRTAILSRPGPITLGNSSRGCSGSRFDDSIRVARGVGDVTLQSSDAKSVFVEKRFGQVSLSLSSLRRTEISDISGDVSIMTSTANRGARLRNIAGAITLMGAGFLRRVEISEDTRRRVGATTIKETSFRENADEIRLTVIRRGKLSISSTNFFNGSAVLRQNGPVVFSGNGDGNVTFVRNNGVRIFENNLGIVVLMNCRGGIEVARNVIKQAVVEGCTGIVSIVQNVFRTLRCFRNVPPPTGKYNSISNAAIGQCQRF